MINVKTASLFAAAAVVIGGVAAALMGNDAEAAPMPEPETDFERDVLNNPEFFREVMEDLGIWSPEEKL